MKLISAHIKNFRSIEDSNDFEINDLTCLVGKNEAGKTAILQALYGIKPFGSFNYEKIRDYPRRYVTRFDERHQNGTSEVIKTLWLLLPVDLKLISDRFGLDALGNNEISISKHIGDDSIYWNTSCNDRACLEHLIQKYALDDIEQTPLKSAKNANEAIAVLTELPQRSESLEELLLDSRFVHSNGQFIRFSHNALIKTGREAKQR